MKKWFKDLRDHYRSLLCDEQYWHDQPGSAWWVRPRLSAAVELWTRAFWWPFVCWLRGHDCDSVADAENGSEDIWCNRCGWHHHAQF